MISVFLIFIFACIASFVGSLQLGPVNLYVINTTLNLGKRAACLIAIGGCIPEFIYCALAVYTNNYLFKYEWLVILFKIIFIIILIIIGIIFYFDKPKKNIIEDPSIDFRTPLQLILKGFSLAALNPQLLPFWIFVQVYFNTISILKIDSNIQKISFITGSGFGAFILLYFFIYMVTKYKKTILFYVNNHYFNKILSLLFIAMATHQIWNLINTFF